MCPYIATFVEGDGACRIDGIVVCVALKDTAVEGDGPLTL